MSEDTSIPRGARASRSPKVFSALGVLAAMVIAVNANVLCARFYERWDVSKGGLYTLSSATVTILHDLPDTVTLTVLLARTDPLLAPLRQLLVSYGARTTRLEVNYLDPEQNPAEFAAVQQKYGVSAGKAEDGRIVADAVILVARGERTWFVTSDELGQSDDDGRQKPRLEQAVTEGIAGVLGSEKAKLCFAIGRGEASIDDVGPEGLAELRRRVEKNNFEVTPLDLTRPDARKPLEGCRLLAIVAPEQPYAPDATERVKSWVQAGGNVVALVGPTFGDDGRVALSGLESLFELGGVRLEPNVVFETDPSRRLPRGAGEVFFGVPAEHAATRGLVLEGGKTEVSVLVSQSRALSLIGGGPGHALVKTSPEAIVLTDVRAVLDGKGPPADAPHAERIVAAAAELEKPAGSHEKHGPRLVFAGFANLAGGRTFQDPALVGDRLLIENALAWAAARPPIVSVPEKPARAVGLALTEESLAEVLRYVLIYMPGSALLVGAFVLLRRRAQERASRREPRGAT
jgi:hypothetical protein